MTTRNYDKIILILLFLTLLTAPVLTMLLHPLTSELDRVENRRFAAMPELRMDMSFLSIPPRFQDYFDDHLGWRDLLIQINAAIKIFCLNTSPNGHVLIGKEGWFFQRSATDQRPYSEEELAMFKDIFEDNQRNFNKRGIKYFVVVVPNSQTIYPEYNPSQYLPQKHWDQYDQLYKYMAANSKLDIMIDLKEDLINNRDFKIPSIWTKSAHGELKTKIYYKWDHHWNTIGTYIGYKTIIHHLKKYYPCMDPIDISSLRTIQKDAHKSLVNLMGANYSGEQDYYLYLPSHFRLKPPINHCPRMTIVILGDSMSKHFMRVLLEQNFSQAIFIYKNVVPDIRLEETLAAHPDVVIDETTERGLGHFITPNNQLPWRKQQHSFVGEEEETKEDSD